MTRTVKNNQSPCVAYVVTVDLATRFLEGQIAFLVRNGFQVHVVCSSGPGLEAMRREGATPWAVNMKREIAIASDMLALWRLWRLFWLIRPDIVVAGTPKAGLLGTLAARLAAVPCVQYTLHGLRFETATGLKRLILMGAEWISCHAAESVRCVSPSLLARVIALGLAPGARCMVIGKGTADGIAIERYAAGARAECEAKRVRRELHIPADAPVLGFVGRFTRDKGIRELYEAFTRLQGRFSGLRLLLVGDFEPGDPVSASLRARIEADPAVIRAGFVDDVERFYWAMDVLAHPTYREGYGTVLLEAQAASVPVVTTNATGAIDAIVDGKTGLCVPVHDADALSAALDRLLGDAELRSRMGAAGHIWVEKNFRREDVCRDILTHYRSLLGVSQIQVISHLQFGNPETFHVQERN
jgi:glycosyltransferase involved in cell wall biosynthesis